MKPIDLLTDARGQIAKTKASINTQRKMMEGPTAPGEVEGRIKVVRKLEREMAEQQAYLRGLEEMARAAGVPTQPWATQERV